MEYNAAYIERKAMAAGFDEAVAEVFAGRTSYLKIANAKIDSIVTMDERNAFLFVTKSKRVFRTNINRIEPGSVGRAIERAKLGVARSVPKDDYYGIADGPFRYGAARKPDRAIAEYDDSTLVDVAQSAINAATAHGADGVAGTLIMATGSAEIETSGGVSARDDSASARLSLRAFRGGLSAQSIAVATRMRGLDPDATAAKTVEYIRMASGFGRIRSGTYDVIYAQQPAGLLLSMVNEMACIGSVETGGFLTGKLGEEIADRNVMLYDDGKSADLVGSGRFDAEGHPTQRNRLIGGGRLLTYLHNHSTSVKYKTESTGNAGLVMPGPNEMALEHGNMKKSLDSLVRSVDRGVLVTNTWYTRFSNYLTGDFSTVPRDIAVYIEHGEPRFAIKQLQVSSATGIRISDNMIRMLKALSRAANDTVQTASWDSDSSFKTPSVLVEGVKITTA